MKRLALAAMLVSGLGCATSSAFRDGQKAERIQDWDQAVLQYSRALQDDPDNAQYVRALGRARRKSPRMTFSSLSESKPVAMTVTRT